MVLCERINISLYSLGDGSTSNWIYKLQYLKVVSSWSSRFSGGLVFFRVPLSKTGFMWFS